MKNLIFLDLEETLIDDWFNGLLLPEKCRKIRQFIQAISYSEIGIFSYAIYNDEDLKKFQGTLKGPLETILEKKITQEVLTIEKIMNIVCKNCNIHSAKFTITDFFYFFNKQGGFLEFAKTFKDTNLWLIDDAVDNIKVNFQDINVNVNIINIDSNKESLL